MTSRTHTRPQEVNAKAITIQMNTILSMYADSCSTKLKENKRKPKHRQAKEKNNKHRQAKEKIDSNK